MRRTLSDERFKAFIDESKKYFNWDIILRDAGITEVADKGDQYEIKCILHEDKRPSLRLTKSVGTYHCFSCGCKGTYTKFLWELSGRGTSYSEFCEQILKAHPQMQESLGFVSLFVSEKTLDPAFNSRRVFDRKAHLGSAMPITSLASKVQKLDNSWNSLVTSLTMLQQGVTTDGVLALMQKQHIEVKEPTEKISLMDLLN